MSIWKEPDMQVTAHLDEERAAKLTRLQSLTQLSAEETRSQGIDLVEQQHENFLPSFRESASP